MKLNSFGVNIDQGLPLSTDEQFEKLYVPFRHDVQERLKDWFINGNKPMLIAGQIGSGKTTLINRVLHDNSRFKYLQLKVDSEVADESTGGLLFYFMVKLIVYCRKENIKFEEEDFINDLDNEKKMSFDSLLEIDENKFRTLANYKKYLKIIERLQESERYFIVNIRRIILIIEKSIGKRFVILFLGVDKFKRKSTGYFCMHSLIRAFLEFKVLVELNSIHFFSSDWQMIDKIYIGTCPNQILENILCKRMGNYWNSIKDVVPKLVDLSGGNPRQAVKLLYNYHVTREKKLPENNSMNASIVQTIRDLFAYSHKPDIHIVNYVRKHHQLAAATLGSVKDADEVENALYGNWIFINEQISGDKWAAEINPLVNFFYKDTLYSFNSEVDILSSLVVPEDLLEIESVLSVDEIETRNAKLLGSKSLNIDRVWDILLGSIMSGRREDRTIIVYKSQEIKTIAQAAIRLKLKLNRELVLREFKVNTINSFIRKLNAVLTQGNSLGVYYSIDLGNSISGKELSKLDKLRDLFIPLKMLWWIDIAMLKEFLQNLPQFRQLFSVVVLEDGILDLISIKEIQADIEAYSKVSNNKQTVIKNLEILKEYMLRKDAKQ